MKFGSTPIPEKLFDLARARMRQDATFTPEDIRAHLQVAAAPELAAISDIKTNQWIVTNRVMRACVAELRAAGEIAQLKKGVWAKSSFLAAAN